MTFSPDEAESIDTPISEIKKKQQIVDHISLNPWLYDLSLTNIDVIEWKLRGDCHVCGMSVKHHRDDCVFSSVQLYFAEMYKNITNINKDESI